METASGLFGRALRSLEMAAAMLTDAVSPYSRGSRMTIYRADLQQYIDTDLVSTGRYYWTNVYYFSADNPTDFDVARSECGAIQARAFCSDVHSDRILITNAATGAVIQHSNFSWVPLGVLPSSDSPITNCVLMWLFADGKRVGYKRYRVPVPMSGMSGGLLTSTFIANYYTSGPGNYIVNGYFCTKDGVLIDHAVVDPFVHSWQLRHGSKRSIRRAV